MRSLHGWGNVGPKHEAGKLIQWITKRALGATEAWTDGRHAEDNRYVELDYELAVALTKVTESAARSTVLKATQVEPSHGSVAWQALVHGYAPKAIERPSRSAGTHTLRHLKDAKDAKELK